MAFSPLETLAVFEVRDRVTDKFIIHVPGNPGDTYTKGEAVVYGAASGNYGCVIAASDSSANVLGFVAKTTVCPAASVAFPIPGKPAGDLDGNVAKTLIPIEVAIPCGTQRVRGACYANALDETVVTYTAATRAVGLTTGFGADDRSTGALVYVYDGPGKGECNIVESYDHTGGAVELLAVMHRAFNTALTTASKLLILANNGAAGDGLGPFGARMDLDTVGKFDAGDGYDDGDWLTVCDWHELGELLEDGTILGVKASLVVP